jgi:hypothetical protein
MEAQRKLKENKLLKDSEQDPAIRVALRSIRDFAIGFKKDNEIYWRYITIPESEIKNYLETKTNKKVELKNKETIKDKEEKIEKEIQIKTSSNEKELEKIKPEIYEKPKFENPLIIEEPKKEKPKSEFALKVIRFINENYKLVQEKEHKSKEYKGIIQIETPLGQINFLTQAKDKKSITEKDIQKLLTESQKIPLPALMIYTGTLSKKAKDYAEVYFSVLKTKKII